MRLRDGVYTFDLDWPDMPEPLSVHVVETGEATVLFGAGDESTAEELAGVAADHDPDAVVVEHGDGDHFGGVAALREAVDPEVAAPAGDRDRLAEAGVAADSWLEPGREYRGVETIAAPGHTPGNLAYRVGGVLVAGDTVVGSDSAFAAGDVGEGPLATIDADYSEDDGQVRESVGNLPTDVEVVLVTHGSNVTDDGGAAVERLQRELGV